VQQEEQDERAVHPAGEMAQRGQGQPVQDDLQVNAQAGVQPLAQLAENQVVKQDGQADVEQWRRVESRNQPAPSQPQEHGPGGGEPAQSHEPADAFRQFTFQG